MKKLLNFPDILYLNETKFAKGCPYEWPYDLESAKAILDNCCSNSSFQELVSDYYFCFKDKYSNKSTVETKQDLNKIPILPLKMVKNNPIENLNDSNLVWSSEDSEWDPREWDGCEKNTILFYHNNWDWQKNLLPNECFNELCPQIKDWDYSTIVCSALFFKIENLIQTEKEIHEVHWKNWIKILVNSAFGPEFKDILDRNAIFELYSKQVIRGFRRGFSLELTFYFFENPTSDQLIRVLQVLRIPENDIDELVSWTFENQNFSKLISFLDNYTFTEFTHQLFTEFLEFLPLTVKDQEKILEEMETQLETFNIWGSTLDDFFVSAQIQNYQELMSEKQSIIKKAFLLATKYKNQLKQDSNLVLSSVPPLCLFEKYLSNLSLEEYKKIKKALFLDKKKTSFRFVSLYLLFFLLRVPAEFLTTLSSLEKAPIPAFTVSISAFVTTQRISKNWQNNLKRENKYSVVLSSKARVIQSNLKKGSFSELASIQKNKSTLNRTCFQDSEDRLTLIGKIGCYDDLKKDCGALNDFQNKNFPGIVFSGNTQVDHILPHRLGQAMDQRCKAGSEYDQSRAIVSTPTLNRIRTGNGQFIRLTPYSESSLETYEHLIKNSWKHVHQRVIETDYSLCSYFENLKTRKEHFDNLLQGYKISQDQVLNDVEKSFSEKYKLEGNLIVPFVEYGIYSLGIQQDIENFSTLGRYNVDIAKVKVKNLVSHLIRYNDEISGLLPYYRDDFAKATLEHYHSKIMNDGIWAIIDTSARHPEVREFKQALAKARIIQLDPTMDKTLQELDQEAQSLGLNNINGQQGRIFYRQGLKNLKRSISF